jgi:adenosylhomocysteine nucleosidase
VLALRVIACGALAACVADAHPTTGEEPRAGVAVLISADAEWTAVRARYSKLAVTASPFGEWLVRYDSGAAAAVVYFHGGWGKIAAAGSTQYVIDHFKPRLIVNLGTCGGFGNGVRVGDIVLVDQAIVYDIVERMGDADEAIRAYTSKLDVDRWPAALRARVRVGHLVSGDRDLAPDDLAALRDRYHAVAGDWESGAIAWVAARNHVPVLVLRGVSDVVSAGGDATYGAPDEWKRRARDTMNAVMSLLDEALPALSPVPDEEI